MVRLRSRYAHHERPKSKGEHDLCCTGRRRAAYECAVRSLGDSGPSQEQHRRHARHLLRTSMGGAACHRGGERNRGAGVACRCEAETRLSNDRGRYPLVRKNCANALAVHPDADDHGEIEPESTDTRQINVSVLLSQSVYKPQNCAYRAALKKKTPPKRGPLSSRSSVMFESSVRVTRDGIRPGHTGTSP